MAHKYQQMNIPILDKKDIQKNQENIENQYNNICRELMSKVIESCHDKGIEYKLLLPIPFDIKLTDRTKGDIYEYLFREGIYACLEIRSYWFSFYDEIYLHFMDKDAVQSRIMKEIGSRQKSNMTKFKYTKYYWNVDKLLADLHLYKLILKPYGYYVERYYEFDWLMRDTGIIIELEN